MTTTNTNLRERVVKWYWDLPTKPRTIKSEYPPTNGILIEEIIALIHAQQAAAYEEGYEAKRKIAVEPDEAIMRLVIKSTLAYGSPFTNWITETLPELYEQYLNTYTDQQNESVQKLHKLKGEG